MSDEGVLLCVQSHHPVDTGNYPGLTRCFAFTEHPHSCVFAWYDRRPGTTETATERMVAQERMLREARSGPERGGQT